MYPTLEKVDTLINNLPIETSQGLLIPESLQEEIILPLLKENKFHEAFTQSFAQPKKASEEHEFHLEQARLLTKIDATCMTWPPLFVRYHGPRDKTIPVILLENGELVVTKKIPDLVLGFSAQFGSILVTICKFSKRKESIYKLTQDILFSMRSSSYLTLEEFQKLYDVTRYEILQKRKFI